MVSFLEEHTGNRLDLERLRSIRALSRRASEIMSEINSLRKAVPCPMGSADAFTALWPLNFIRGSKECDDFYDSLLKELKERVNQGIGVVPEEKFRLMWTGLPFWYNMRLLNYPEDFGGVVVIEGMVLFPHRYTVLPPQDEDPIKDLALTITRQRQWPAGIGDTIDTVSQVVRDYKLEGVVVTFNPSCRLSYIPQQELVNGLTKLGIPSLALECDMADERTYSEGQVKTRMEAFFESLLTRNDRMLKHDGR
jgi:benzoyl-CoA reductase/2-hydroxyglutaryl-CoA dehydratase subunit BcrC/BadD/HgdB